MAEETDKKDGVETSLESAPPSTVAPPSPKAARRPRVKPPEEPEFVPPPDDPEPPLDPMFGSKTPDYMRWLARNQPEQFRARYKHAGGALVRELLASLPAPQPAPAAE